MIIDKIGQLKDWIDQSDNLVFFGGAGVSTESGIPDFRSTDGIYNMNYSFPPEIILSHSFFLENTKIFFDFYKERMINLNANPNITHLKLVELEELGKLKAIITQNIDGLHQKAGSKNVIELHGSILCNRCMKCNKLYDINNILNSKDIPLCKCKGIIKPEVVLYEEPLNNQLIKNAIELISEAEVLIIGGTSLSVYPAANMIKFYKGDKLVLINKDKTHMDHMADLLIYSKLGEVFSYI